MTPAQCLSLTSPGFRIARRLLAALCATTAFSVAHADADTATWRDHDDDIAGWDWSLPPSTEPAAVSALKLPDALVPPHFKGHLTHAVTAMWRDLEPTEGHFDFESLRRRILAASAGGRYAVELGLRASVWEIRIFPGEARYPAGWSHIHEENESAPRWLARCAIPRIEEEKKGLSKIGTPFQIINLDIYHPAYHERYLRLIRALGASGILRMPELTVARVGIYSSSRGEEGVGPASDDPDRARFVERLQAWADAAGPARRKLMIVSNRPDDLADAIRLGMGQRNGFVEHYMMHCRNAMLGQSVDAQGYLTVDESNPIIAENRASGDENEEYNPVSHVARFGPESTWPHRYRESMLRVLQMRRNYVWAESGPRLIDPPLLRYVALELGRTAADAPDAWCYLRESVIVGDDHAALPVKNFERWIFQRDAAGARTVATARVTAIGKQNSRAPGHLCDFTARRTDHASGDSVMRFAVADDFLSGPADHLAVKITYRDEGDAHWTLVCTGDDGRPVNGEVACGHTGAVRTATFFLPSLRFDARGFDPDFLIRADTGDAVISLVRLIKIPAAHP